MEIQADRLLLRRPRIGDLEAMFEIMSNKLAMRYWSTLPHESREVTRTWLDQMIARTAAGDEDFVIEHEGRAIGIVGAGRIPDFGFILHPEYWGRGFAAEASEAFIAYVFGNALASDCRPMSIHAMSPRCVSWPGLALRKPAAPSIPFCSATNGATAFI